MTVKNPLLSIIIPCFNAEKYLEEAIESIYLQGIENYEVILVDDGSTDNTSNLIQRKYPEFTYIYQENAGPSAARNTGIKESNGEFIAFLDADDMWCKNKTKLQLQQFKEDQELDVVSGLGTHLFMKGSEYRKEQYVTDEKGVFNIYLVSTMVRSNVFDKIGLLDESLRFSEDQDWFLRVRENDIKMTVINEVVFQYRIHENNSTALKTTKDLGILKALRKSLQRRREKGDMSINELPTIENQESDKTSLK